MQNFFGGKGMKFFYDIPEKRIKEIKTLIYIIIFHEKEISCYCAA